MPDNPSSCPYCNQQHPSDVKICPITGQPLICPKCEVSLRPRDNECPNCGTDIIRPVVQVAPVAPPVEVPPRPPEPPPQEVEVGRVDTPQETTPEPTTKEGELKVDVIQAVQELVAVAQQQQKSGDLQIALVSYQQAFALAKEGQRENPILSLTVQMLTHEIEQTEKLIALARKDAVRRKADERAEREEQTRQERAAEERARREAEERAKREEQVRLQRTAEERSRREAVERTQREAQEKVRREAEEQARREAQQRAKETILEFTYLPITVDLALRWLLLFLWQHEVVGNWVFWIGQIIVISLGVLGWTIARCNKIEKKAGIPENVHIYPKNTTWSILFSLLVVSWGIYTAVSLSAGWVSWLRILWAILILFLFSIYIFILYLYSVAAPQPIPKPKGRDWMHSCFWFMGILVVGGVVWFFWLLFTSTTTGGGGKIAFASDRDGNAEIYVMSADGSGATRLTNNSAYDGVPAWSPEGEKIAFISERDDNDEIYVMNADGSGVTRLTNNPAHDGDPTWSPDGKRIAFVSYRDGNYEIYVMNADGSGVTRLTNNPAYDRAPAWSPDGKSIAFTSYRDGNYEIYVMNADGSGVTRLTNNPAYDADPAWSLDGKRIAFVSERDGNAEIYVMNSDGGGQINLTNNPAYEWTPDWSPDGKEIAFMSYRDGNAEIYVINADGSRVNRLTHNSAHDETPAWSPELAATPAVTESPTATSDWTATAYAEKTAAARAAATATTQAYATAQARATATARAAVTATAQARAIAEAQATATAQARADILSAIESNKLRVFGPEDGSLVHDVDEYIENYAAGVELRDFIVEAEFINPYSTSTGSWDYGFLFRDEGGNQQFRLVIISDRYWALFDVAGDADVPAISEGEIPTLNISEGGSNRVRLICQGERGWLFVNGEFIAELDLSARTNAGDIIIATGMYEGDEINGKTTNFENFTIWSIIQIVNTLAYNDLINSSINDAIGEYWSFYGGAGDRVTIAMDGSNSFDTYLELYGPDGNLLVSNDDGGSNNNALIGNYVLPVTGTYIINARGFSGATGSYTLSLTGP